MGGTKKNGILKGDRDNEACISQIRRQKAKLKSRQFILRVIQHYLSRNIGTTQLKMPNS
jgi:hypothetical protein